VADDADAQVRDAAAEAYGALNLPPDQAEALILRQHRATLEPQPADAAAR
jgi:hypothetical protein